MEMVLLHVQTLKFHKAYELLFLRNESNFTIKRVLFLFSISRTHIAMCAIQCALYLSVSKNNLY